MTFTEIMKMSKREIAKTLAWQERQAKLRRKVMRKRPKKKRGSK